MPMSVSESSYVDKESKQNRRLLKNMMDNTEKIRSKLLELGLMNEDEKSSPSKCNSRNSRKGSKNQSGSRESSKDRMFASITG